MLLLDHLWRFSSGRGACLRVITGGCFDQRGLEWLGLSEERSRARHDRQDLLTCGHPPPCGVDHLPRLLVVNIGEGVSLIEFVDRFDIASGLVQMSQY